MKKSMLKKVEENLKDLKGVIKESASVVTATAVLYSAVKGLKSETGQKIAKEIIKGLIK